MAPPICKAKNPKFCEKPPPGSSIGIGGYVDQTGTLGGYIKIRDVTYILTVHHLLPEDYFDYKTGLIKGERASLTQASAQESAEARITELLDDLYTRMENCCPVCKDHWKQLFEHGRQRSDYHIGSHAEDSAVLQGWVNELGEKCSLAHLAVSMKLAEHSYKAYPFAYLGMTSGFRSRQTCSTEDSYMVEMDWALYTPLEHRIGTNAHEKAVWRTIGDIIPGSKVCSVGRTSGYHQGMINTSMSYVDFGDH
jgi:hypothetical protein